MTRRAFVATTALLPALATTGWAHPGHSHKVLGTIAKIDGKRITLTGTDGKAVTLVVNNRTKLVRDPKTKGLFEEIKAGMRAVVTLGDGEDEGMAMELRYAEAQGKK